MNLKSRINQLLGHVGLRVVSTARIGITIFNEIEQTGIKVRTVFDVGANVGNTCATYLKHFPEAQIYAFEPVEDNFQQLQSISNRRFHANKLAMGLEEGIEKVYLSSQNFKHSAVVIEDKNKFVTVEKTNISAYCSRHGISQIGFLKIDTEGRDLEVLRGAELLLKKSRIDFILVEAGFHQQTKRHVYLGEFLDYLNGFSYGCFGIYDQTLEWNRRAQLGYVNVLFSRYGIMMRD